MLKIEKQAIAYLFAHHCKICGIYVFLRSVLLLGVDLLIWLPVGIVLSIVEKVVVGTWHWFRDAGMSLMLDFQRHRAAFSCVGRAWKGPLQEKKEDNIWSVTQP